MTGRYRVVKLPARERPGDDWFLPDLAFRDGPTRLLEMERAAAAGRSVVSRRRECVL